MIYFFRFVSCLFFCTPANAYFVSIFLFFASRNLFIKSHHPPFFSPTFALKHFPSISLYSAKRVFPLQRISGSMSSKEREKKMTDHSCKSRGSCNHLIGAVGANNEWTEQIEGRNSPPQTHKSSPKITPITEPKTVLDLFSLPPFDFSVVCQGNTIPTRQKKQSVLFYFSFCISAIYLLFI